MPAARACACPDVRTSLRAAVGEKMLLLIRLQTTSGAPHGNGKGVRGHLAGDFVFHGCC